MKFYLFRQNNSGGSFTVTPQLNKNVFIQANSAREANILAGDIGIYFNGVDKGRDCDCCGDRWSEVDKYDAVETVQFDEWIREEETVVHYFDSGNKNFASLTTKVPQFQTEPHRRLELS